MAVYRISINPGFSPMVTAKKTEGFIKAPTREKAIVLFLKHHNQGGDIPTDRVVAETKTEVGKRAWEIEQELFPMFPKFAMSAA